NNPVATVDPWGLVGIFLGGAAQKADDRTRTIARLYHNYDDTVNGTKLFIESPGPAAFKVSVKNEAAALANLIESYVKKAGCKGEPVGIFGFSRGAVVGALLAEELRKRGVPVRFVGLIDPVTTKTDAEDEALPIPNGAWLGVKGNPSEGPLSNAKTDRAPT